MIKLVLSPAMKALDASEGSIGVDITLEDYSAEAGELILKISKKTIMKTFLEFIREIKITDDEGEIPCEITEGDGGSYVTAVSYFAGRKTSGNIKVSYSCRVPLAGGNPCFDLGVENGGMTGSGMTFIPAFREGKYEYSVKWDLSGMPDFCVGCWSFGEGNVTGIRGDENLASITFYMAGRPECVKYGRYAFYWFEHNDRILKYAVDTSAIFEYEADFFNDHELRYNVFCRKLRSEKDLAGGTALDRSYIYGYSDFDRIPHESIIHTFAHEMVHNWMEMDNSPFGTCTWYIEGGAEYYSAVLPYRMGILSREEFRDAMNRRAVAYYKNRYRHVDDMEPAGKLFADSEIMNVPYGRGFCYLTHADEEIRRKTDGKHSLDDIAKKLAEMYKSDRHIQNEAWLEEYAKYVGREQAEQELRDLKAGKDIVPGALCSEGALRLTQVPDKENVTDKDILVWKYELTEEEK